MNKILCRMKYFICAVALYLCFASSAAYSNFGKTCEAPSSTIFPSTALSYLASNSVYGYVLSLIDIQNCGDTYLGGCIANSNNSINICIKNTDAPSIVTATHGNSTQQNLIPNQSITLGEITNNPTILLDENLSNILLTVKIIGNQLCIFMPTQYGNMPLICKNVAASTQSQASGDVACRTVSSGCSLYSNNVDSKTPNNFLGSAVQCIYESLSMIFFDPTICAATPAQLAEYGTTTVKPFAEFYSKLQLAVASALTLYLIFYGIRIALKPEEASLQDGFLAMVKIILVVYFSVGSTFFDFLTGKQKNSNGVTELILPTMISFADSMSSYILGNSSSNNMCYFDISEYSTNSYFAIWDALDCRLNIYIGNSKVFWDPLPAGSAVVFMPNAVTSSKASIDYDAAHRPSYMNSSSCDSAGNCTSEGSHVIAFCAVLLAFFLGGGFLIFILLGVVITMILGMVFSILSAYLVSIVLMYILAYIAPIFVPMALFERTKGYYTSWLNLCMGTSLQPVIIVSFGIYLLTLIDSFMFDQCTFVKYRYLDAQSTIKYIFELQLPTGHEAECQSSVGYKLYRLFQSGSGWSEKSFLFFKAVKLTDVYDLEGNIMSGVIMCFFMRYVLEQMYTITAQMSGGVNLSGATISPVAVMNGVVKVAGTIKNEAKAMFKSKDEKK